MVVDERSRHELYRRLEEVLGSAARFNAMDHRLMAVTSALRSNFERELRSQTTTFEDGLRSLVTTMVFGLVSVVLTMAALAFALVRFT